MYADTGDSRYAEADESWSELSGLLTDYSIVVYIMPVSAVLDLLHREETFRSAGVTLRELRSVILCASHTETYIIPT